MRLRTKIAAGVLFVLLSLVCGRNLLIKVCLLRTAPRYLGGSLAVGRVESGFNSLTLYDFRADKPHASLTCARVTLRFRWQGIAQPELTSVTIEQIAVEARGFKDLVSGTGVPMPSGGSRAPPVAVRVDRGRIKMREPFPLTVQGDVDLMIRGKGISAVKNLTVRDGRIETGPLKIDQIILRECPQDGLVLELSGISLKGKDIVPIRVPVEKRGMSYILKEFSHPLLGARGTLAGRVDLAEFVPACVRLSASNISAASLVQLAGGKEKVTITGAFSGDLRLCANGAGGLPRVSGLLENSDGGKVQIKQEKPFPFLQKRMTPRAYRALVANLQDYRYNGASWELSRAPDGLMLELRFFSEEMGERNFTVYFHDIRGGEQ
ncbi:MAG: hypothetical protein GF333_01030 [Candidatus Omnitrophica bacterium]|nr:hypothetical protein [Candidatus Omnitrophota bacterium]